MNFEQRLLSIWYGEKNSGWWLAPLGAVYRSLAGLRRRLYQRGWLRRTRLRVPVIVVGNITAGGTGKTPLVIWLVARLAAAGFRVGVLTGGYRGKSSQWPLTVTSETDPREAGDEAVLIARRTGARVTADPNRVRGALQLVTTGVDVIVCDDGMQHYALERDCEIAVIDAARGFGNGRFIPAGPLRESRQRLESVTAVVVNGAGGDWPHLRMQVAGDKAVALTDGQPRPLTDWQGENVHAIAGMGNPGRFFDLLDSQGIGFKRHTFADHAEYRPGDLDFGDNLAIFMTEKDAVKCAAFATAAMYYVPVEVTFSGAAAAQLLQGVSAATGLALTG